MVVFFEGIVMCFILVMYCVIRIRNGAVGLVCLYDITAIYIKQVFK